MSANSRLLPLLVVAAAVAGIVAGIWMFARVTGAG
jgi:hypothetical protein